MIALEQETAPSKSTVSEVPISEGTVVCVSKGSQQRMQPSPYSLAILNENLHATENATAKVKYFAQDPVLPCQFVETAAVGELQKANILSIVMNCQKEDDTIVLSDEAYYCLLVNALDNGDTRTVTKAIEQDHDMQSDEETPTVATRSIRNKNCSNYVLY